MQLHLGHNCANSITKFQRSGKSFPTSFWVGKDDRMPVYFVYLHQCDGAPEPGREHDGRRHRREAEWRRPFLQQRRLPSPPRGGPLIGRGHSADFHSQSYIRLILLCIYPLSIRMILLHGYPYLYQVALLCRYSLSILSRVASTPRISIPISGCFYSSDIHSQSYIRLIILCGYPISILYQVYFTLRISTLNPKSG